MIAEGGGGGWWRRRGKAGAGGWKTMLLRHVGVQQPLSQTSRMRAACPISYRQNALKMPQASRAVIIEETRARGWVGRRDGAKLRRGKLRAALGLRDEDDDARLPHASAAMQLCSW